MPRGEVDDNLLWQHVARELHPHEHPAAPEADQHGSEPHELQHHPVKLGGAGVVRLVEDDHPRPAQAEHEAAGQPLHDVLTIDTVGHEGHWSLVTMFISGAAHTGGLHYHIVDYTTWNNIEIRI